MERGAKSDPRVDIWGVDDATKALCTTPTRATTTGTDPPPSSVPYERVRLTFRCNPSSKSVHAKLVLGLRRPLSLSADDLVCYNDPVRRRTSSKAAKPGRARLSISDEYRPASLLAEPNANKSSHRLVTGASGRSSCDDHVDAVCTSTGCESTHVGRS